MPWHGIHSETDATWGRGGIEIGIREDSLKREKEEEEGSCGVEDSLEIKAGEGAGEGTGGGAEEATLWGIRGGGKEERITVDDEGGAEGEGEGGGAEEATLWGIGGGIGERITFDDEGGGGREISVDGSLEINAGEETTLWERKEEGEGRWIVEDSLTINVEGEGATE